jgi:hypothetical protein
VIHIDRVRTDLDVVGTPPQDAARPAQTASVVAFDRTDRGSRDQFREFVLEVLGEHLRDLERRGLA